MSSRVVALIAFLVLGAATVLTAGFLTPWKAAPATDTKTTAAVPRPDASTDFTDAEIARGSAFRAAVRPWSLSRLILGLVIAVALGLTPLGARLIGAVARPLGGSWWVEALLGGIVLGLVATVVTLPLSARTEVLLRRYGLSTQNWGGWFADLAKGWAISAVLTAVVTLVLYALIRATPNWWWTWAAAGAAAFVLLASFAFPVLIEPLFNKFTPMPDSALRTSLLQLAERDGEPVKDVLVADASRRTTALNAYVSGYGASRRIVVYDTLLESAPPEEVESVVAHELGHAVDKDVVTGTVLGALGAAAAVCGLALLGAWSPLLKRAGVDDLTDPRSLGLLLAIVAVAGAFSTPIQAVVSRRIEARADEHSLELTRDPDAFVSMERRLALQNRADLRPNPVYQFWFGTHPTTVERIAAARNFAAREDLPIPGPTR